MISRFENVIWRKSLPQNKTASSFQNVNVFPKKKNFISSHFSFFLLEHPLVKEWISIVWFPLMGGGEKVRKTREAINKGFHCLKNEHESSSWSFDHFGRGNTQGNTLEKSFQPQATRKHMLSGTSGEIYWMKTRTLRLITEKFRKELFLLCCVAFNQCLHTWPDYLLLEFIFFSCDEIKFVGGRKEKEEEEKKILELRFQWIQFQNS